MLEWCGGKNWSNIRGTTEQRESPSKTAARTRSRTYFPRTDTCGFKKKKRNRKKNTNSSYLWWMFLLWLCYTTRTRLNFVSLWCTYVSHKTQDDFFNVLQAMKRVSHARVGVFPTGTHCRVHPPLSVVCICVVLHSKGNWMVCQCVFYTFFIWVQWDHVETIYDESIKRFFLNNIW